MRSRNDIHLGSTPSATARSDRAAAALPVFRPPADARPTGKYALELSVTFLSYLIAGRIGLLVPFTSGNVSPVWPAAGVALAALLIVGFRVWPAIAAAAFLVNLFTPVPFLAALGMAAGNTAGAVVAAWLTRCIRGFTPSLTRIKDVFGLITVAVPVGTGVSAWAGVTVLSALGVAAWGSYSRALLVWWLGDAMGMLLITPVALTVLGRRFESRRQAAEFAVLLGGAGITCLLMFDPVGVGGGVVLAAAITPFVLWAAIRFESFGATAVVLVVSSIAVWETGLGLGPFTQGSTAQNAARLQAFIATIAVSGLALAAAVAEKSHLVQEKAHREALAEGERKYRQVVETANDGIWMLDDRLVTIFANGRLASLLGYTVPELLGRPLLDFIFEEDAPHATAALREPTPHAIAQFRRRFRRKDGSELSTLVSRTLIFDNDGAFTGVLQMISDLTAFKRAEEDRQRARERVVLLSQAVEQTSDSVFMTDAEGVIEYVNRAYESMTGYSRAEAVGATPRLVGSGRHDASFYAELWATIRSGRVFRAVMTNKTKDGRVFEEDQTITPLRDESGKITHFVATGRDITPMKRTEEALRRLNERLEHEATRIAFALHDEAGQMLTSAHLALAALSRDLPLPMRERVQEVRHHLEDVEGQLRELSHELRPRILDDLGLVPALRFLAEGVTRRSGIVVTVQADLPKRCPALVETTLYRMVQEALTNVMKHSKATRGFIVLTGEDARVHCVVRDNGAGIAHGATPPGQTGLGLFGIRDRVEGVGGTFDIGSSPDGGTELRATIPLEV